MHFDRFDRRMNPITLEIKLLYLLHPMGSGKVAQEAQEDRLFARLQERIWHQVAFSFLAHPGHRPERYAPQAPQ